MTLPDFSAPWGDEPQAIQKLHASLPPEALPWPQVVQTATPWLADLRAHPPAFWAMESLLQAYPLSSAQGLALMRLAEALLRVPDADTMQLLLSDQLAQGDFAHGHAPPSGSTHPWWDAISHKVLALATDWMQSDSEPGPLPALQGLLQQWGQAATVRATLKAVQLLGHQFVLAPDIDSAWRQARITFEDDAQRHWQTRWSFDMLGEGARTWHDADHYFAAYERALNTLAEAGPASAGQGLSVKLSALHPRFEVAHADSVMQHLRPRLLQLARLAAHHGLLLTLDAEESDRLTLQAQVLQALVDDLARDQARDQVDAPALANWSGLGLAVQAYQLRAPDLIQWLIGLSERSKRKLTVRLVKGAYWDGEIKRAQNLGLAGYPVYTRKAHTDLSYLACARLLLAHTEQVFPQFATHNAVTIAAVMTLARQAGVGVDRYEWQRLHGMGEATYQHIRQHVPTDLMAPVRVYAPVGPHRDLLAYLVRRLLENGANSSFVHQLADPALPLDALLQSPYTASPGTPGLPAPCQAWGGEHPQAPGRDLAHGPHLQALQQAVAMRLQADFPAESAPDVSVDEHVQRLHQAWPEWEARTVAERAQALTHAADHLCEQFDSWVADLVVEAHKTLPDAVAEVRETIDFARYYAAQAMQVAQPRDLPAPTGESNRWCLRGRGVFVCIAPWNFPLAIFGGQVMAALVMGNAVAAKSAPQTPQVAERFVRLLHDCGVPAQVLQHVPGDATAGAALVAHPLCGGVAFTGSVVAAKRIQLSLAAADRPIVPLLAETGGINAMVVDSTALPEQVLDAVVQSAFHSAGQRCSALRLLCLHTAVAAPMERMLAGAMQTLRVGLPQEVATDVGPVIDAAAAQRLQAWVQTLDAQASDAASGVVHLATAPAVSAGVVSAGHGLHWVLPTAYRLPSVAHLQAEHFGPVLHVVHWGPGTSAPMLDALMDQINAKGFGLTLGLQTRIDARVGQVAQLARVGNVYVNRGMTGAVVGAQPFGGQGWSGSGPKAGGPLYLPRFAVEQVVSVNTAAAGGNVGLLAR